MQQQYISASEGTTGKLAEEISLAANGAEIFKLEPQMPYTQSDINWHDKQSRSSVEMDDESCRVPLANADFDFSDFDTIFVGFPICGQLRPELSTHSSKRLICRERKSRFLLLQEAAESRRQCRI